MIEYTRTTKTLQTSIPVLHTNILKLHTPEGEPYIKISFTCKDGKERSFTFQKADMEYLDYMLKQFKEKSL